MAVVLDSLLKKQIALRDLFIFILVILKKAETLENMAHASDVPIP